MDPSLKTVKVRPETKERLEKEQVRISTRNGKMASLNDVIDELLDYSNTANGIPVRSKCIEDDLNAQQRQELRTFVAILKSTPEQAGMTSLRGVIMRAVKEWAKATEAGAR